jgi:hypothetical protein
VNPAHCHHWSVWVCLGAVVTMGSLRGSVVVPVKLRPPLFDWLNRILLLHAPGVLTPVYKLVPKALIPAGTQPLVSSETRLM